MPTCFVIQPFDGGKFDKRFNDTFKPAIEAAELDAYRVDQDSSVSVPIESIEKGIRQSTICLADITEDNPNVWYELSFAFALGKPVVMVCAEDRSGKYPFDIQHKHIIKYKTEASSDFRELQEKIADKIRATLSREDVLERMAEEESPAPVQGLSPIEFTFLTVVAGLVLMPETHVGIGEARRDSEKAGLNKLGINLAIRKLQQKIFIIVEDVWDQYNNDKYVGVTVTAQGWDWLEENEPLLSFNTHEKTRAKSGAPKAFDDFDTDITF